MTDDARRVAGDLDIAAWHVSLGEVPDEANSNHVTAGEIRKLLNRLAAAENERDALNRMLVHIYDLLNDGSSHLPRDCDLCLDVDRQIEKVWGKERVRG